jgi:hypothetical protein
MVSPTASACVWAVSEQDVGAPPESPVVVEHVTLVDTPLVGEPLGA